MNERVSVIIPTYKRPRMLGRAIDSVLNQTYKKIEIIVVDDNNEGSKERKETELFMKKYNDIKEVVYLKHRKNKNSSGARNTGIKYSTSKYLAFLDDDDEFKKDKIKKQVNYLKEKNLKGCYTLFIRKKSGKIIQKSIYSKEGNLKFETLNLTSKIGAGSTLIIDREVINQLKGFDASFLRHHDIEFLVRYFEKFEIGCVKEHLTILNVDDEINRPNGTDLKKTHEKFLKKYKIIIDSLSKAERKEVYSNHNFELFKVYLKNKELLNAIKYFIKSRPNKKTLKQFFLHLKIKIKEIKIRDKTRS